MLYVYLYFISMNKATKHNVIHTILATIVSRNLTNPNNIDIQESPRKRPMCPPAAANTDPKS